MRNDSAHERTVGAHSEAFSGGASGSRFRPVMCSKRCCGFPNTGAQWHMLPTKLSELQNCASTLTIMAIVDRHGLPLSVSTHAANHHEVRLVQLCFDFYMIEAKPENLIGDRAYDSDPLDDELRNDGIEMIAPHRSNRSKPPTQNRRRLSRYMRRWMKPDSCLWSLHQGIDRQGGIFLRASTTILGVMRRSAAVGSGAYSGSTGGFFGRPACRQRQFCAGK
jgi:Transposase DDE domain